MVPLKTMIGVWRPDSCRSTRTMAGPTPWGMRRSSAIRSSLSPSRRTSAVNSDQDRTARTSCPAASSAVANRSRTKAVSSATTTVLTATMVAAVIRPLYRNMCVATLGSGPPVGRSLMGTLPRALRRPLEHRRCSSDQHCTRWKAHRRPLEHRTVFQQASWGPGSLPAPWISRYNLHFWT